jgi:hypothetical protein
MLTPDLKKDIGAILAILEPVKDAINVVQSNTALLSDLSSAYLSLHDNLVNVPTSKVPSFLDKTRLDDIARRRTWDVFLPVHVSTRLLNRSESMVV